MKSPSTHSVLWCSLLALALVPLFAAAAAAQSTTDPTPREEGEALEENLRYGHSVTDGTLALAADNIATFCPDPAILVVHPAHRDEVLKQLNAEAVDDETWVVPDPDTGEAVTAKVQYAGAVYSDDEAATGAQEQKLPILSTRAISVVPILWPRCWSIKLHHICGAWGSCGPAGCLPGGFTWTQLRNFLVCRPQIGSVCLQFLSPVCRLNRFFCKDCTGPIVATWISPRWVCAVF